MFLRKKAEVGIGTLIIFIALIFVASIAAHVLIQTSTSLQAKALETAKQTKENVATRLEMISLSATDGSDATLEDFKAQMKLSPGGSAIDLRKLTVGIGLNNASFTLIYSNESCQRASDASGDGYYSNSTTLNGTFTVQYIQTAKDHVDGVLQRGEIIKLCFGTPWGIEEDEEFSLRFVPKIGLPTQKDIITDSVIVRKNVLLYP